MHGREWKQSLFHSCAKKEGEMRNRTMSYETKSYLPFLLLILDEVMVWRRQLTGNQLSAAASPKPERLTSFAC